MLLSLLGILFLLSSHQHAGVRCFTPTTLPTRSQMKSSSECPQPHLQLRSSQRLPHVPYNACLRFGSRSICLHRTTKIAGATMTMAQELNNGGDNQGNIEQSSADVESNWLNNWWRDLQPKGVTKRRIQGMINSNDPEDAEEFIMIVTGATGGIGKTICKTTLKHLSDNVNFVIAVDINKSALDDLKDELTSSEDDKSARLSTVVSDFADLSSVSTACQDIIAKLQAYHSVRKNDSKPQKLIIVNNAGIHYIKDDNDPVGITADGYDLCFQINYLSHFLFTESLLQSILVEGGGPQSSTNGIKQEDTSIRVVQVTSGMHWCVNGSDLLKREETNGSIYPNTDDPPASWDGRRTDRRLPTHVSNAYGNSKLSQIWYANYLNRRYAQSTPKEQRQVAAVCACPSWAATGIAGDDDGRKLLQLLAFSTEPPDAASTAETVSGEGEEYIAGPAVSSVLNAMFLPTCQLDPDILLGRKLIGNSRIFERFTSDDPVLEPMDILDSALIRQIFGGRSQLVQFMARSIILFFQRFCHEEITLQATSYEASNNRSGEEELIGWSQKAVKEYLPEPSKVAQL